ncbi:MAG: hypothetical protein M3N32_07095 [Actinomycetota bacterium]|nr:hypothetical protein [Actinomycetota bacterium]
MTERIYATDAYARELTSKVVDVDRDDHRVLLDRIAKVESKGKGFRRFRVVLAEPEPGGAG